MKGVGLARQGWSWLRLRVLDPLGAVLTLALVVSFVAGVLKTTDVLTLAGADPIGVGLIAVSLVLLTVGIVRSRPAARRPDETPPPPKAPPLTLADASPPPADPYGLAYGRGQASHTSPLATAALPDTHIYRRAAAEAERMRERVQESNRRAAKRAEMKEVLGGLLRARTNGQRLLQDLRYADSPLLAGSDAVGDPESRYDPWAKQIYELIDRVPTHLTAAFHVAARPSEPVPDFPFESVPTQLKRHVERILSALEIVIEGLPETYREAG